MVAPLVGMIIWLTDIKVEGKEQYLIDGGIALFATLAGLSIGLLVTWKLNKGSYRFREHKSTACIVCAHVMNKERPILYAWYLYCQITISQ